MSLVFQVGHIILNQLNENDKQFLKATFTFTVLRG